MVRFIMIDIPHIFDSVNTIYIPIWLDLLLLSCQSTNYYEAVFTFQYG